MKKLLLIAFLILISGTFIAGCSKPPKIEKVNAQILSVDRTDEGKQNVGVKLILNDHVFIYDIKMSKAELIFVKQGNTIPLETTTKYDETGKWYYTDVYLNGRELKTIWPGDYSKEIREKMRYKKLE